MKTIYTALLVTGVVFAVPANARAAGPTAHKLTAENSITPVATYHCRRHDRGWHYLRGERRVTCRSARPREGGTNLWGWKCEGPRCGWWHQKERHWHDRG